MGIAWFVTYQVIKKQQRHYRKGVTLVTSKANYLPGSSSL